MSSLLDLGVEAGDANLQIGGVLIEALRFGVVAAAVGLTGGEADLALPFGFLLFELADLLVGRGHLFRLAVETFVTMAAHAAAQAESFAPGVQRVRHFRDDLFDVALLAAGLEVFPMMHGPEPEFVTSVGLDGAIDCGAIAAVARRAAELLRIVDLQQLPIGMADEKPPRLPMAAFAVSVTGSRVPR